MYEENFEIPDAIVKMYSKDINLTKLKQQAQMLPDLVKTYKTSQGLSRFTVTKVRSIADMLLDVPSAKSLFSEIDHLLILFLSVQQQLKEVFLVFDVLKHFCDPQ